MNYGDISNRTKTTPASQAMNLELCKFPCVHLIRFRLVKKQSATVKAHTCALSWHSPFKLPALGPILQHILLVDSLLSILDPRAAHFQSCHWLRLKIYYPCVHSVSPNFIIFRKHWKIPVGLHIHFGYTRNYQGVTLSIRYRSRRS